MPHRLDRVAQRLENGPEEPLAAPHGQDIEPGLQRDRRRRQLRAVLAAALKGRAEDLGDRHAQERRGDVGAVVDVLVEQPLRLALAPDHAHRVHVEQQAGRASFGRRFRVENVRLAEAQVEALKASGCLCSRKPRSVAGWCVVVIVSSMRPSNPQGTVGAPVDNRHSELICIPIKMKTQARSLSAQDTRSRLQVRRRPQFTV